MEDQQALGILPGNDGRTRLLSVDWAVSKQSNNAEKCSSERSIVVLSNEWWKVTRTSKPLHATKFSVAGNVLIGGKAAECPPVNVERCKFASDSENSVELFSLTSGASLSRVLNPK
ncbi:uncharacterized protein HKW66_Vig0153540 [Vigna angularis]|uniref:Uncharacterized protein n=1 Tax=Phaseolus angularis TaxID=3914 RepID=A0A8T0JNI1_PHAAN|nr:uncharacterized protein HKW66_Vig0153540 [Vigna angularis]